MKKIFFTIFTITVTTLGYSQDILLKKSGDKIEAKITEVSDDYIKYKKVGMENGPDFKISVSDLFMLTFEGGEKMMFDKKTESDHFMLLGGTKVQLRMTETISSDKKGGRKVTTGEVISLVVHQDVTDIDGNVLIKQGTVVNGNITNAVKRKAAGTKGKLSFSVSSVRSIDNQSIPVNFKYDFAGKSKTGVAVAAGALVAAPLLLIKGKPAIVEAGTIFEALVSTDRKISSKNK